MVARAEDGVAAVTASPYHPDGGVAGVAAWRLWLSKLASSFYRVLSQNKLHTYTSCFRVYRREAVADIHLRYRRFAGVAEILWHLDRAGGKVVEYPIVLHCRQVGQSKLRVVPVMLEHLRLLTRCAWERLFTAGKPVFRPTTSNLSDCRSHARAPARDAPPAASAEIIEL
jgi:dolichol-phosphate mannosyltransferase